MPQDLSGIVREYPLFEYKKFFRTSTQIENTETQLSSLEVNISTGLGKRAYEPVH